MKDFKIIEVEQLKNSSRYKLIEEGIYLDKEDKGRFACHRLAMEMTLEEGEGSQYPLEDILDEYYVHVEIFLESEEERRLKYIFGGELDNLQDLKLIIGKRAYNEEYVNDEGQSRVRLIIE